MHPIRINYNSFFLILIFVSILTGCTNKKEALIYNTYLDEENIDGYNIEIEREFSAVEKDSIVIYQNDQVKNENKIDEFYEKTMNNEDAVLTMIKYTDAKEEIVLSYVYKDETYTLYIDSSHVEGEKGKITKRTIKDIEIGYNSLGQKIIIEKY